MKLLNYHDGDFHVAHFQGYCHVAYTAVIAEMKKTPIKIPDDVTVVTMANAPDNCLLIKQLKANKMPFLNHAEPGGDWKNTMKPGYIRKSLDEVRTEYALILDAGDVLLTGDLTDIVARFKAYTFDGIPGSTAAKALKMLFGASKNNHPNMLIDKVYGRDYRGEFRYLNAGTAFGYTDYCKAFYKEVDRLIWEDELKAPNHSEQFFVRHVFKDRMDAVDFDYKCDIFQTFGKTEAECLDVEENIYRIV